MNALSGEKKAEKDIFISVPSFIFFLTPIFEIIVAGLICSKHPLADNYVYPFIFFVSVVLSFFFVFYSLISQFREQRAKLFNCFKNNTLIVFLFACIFAAVNSLKLFPTEDMDIIIHFILVISNFCCFYFSSQLVESANVKRTIIYMFMFVNMAVNFITIIDEYICSIPAINIEGICSLFFNANHYGYFLTMGVVLSASLFELEYKPKLKIYLAILYIVNCVALAMSGCFGSFISSIIALIFLVIVMTIKNRKFSFSSLGLIGLLLVISFFVGMKYQSFFTQFSKMIFDIGDITQKNEEAIYAGSGRWGIWIEVVKQIKEHPLTGWGAYGSVISLQKEIGIGRPHNEYLAYAVWFGIPCAVLYIAGLMLVFFKAFKYRNVIDKYSIACLVTSLAYIVSAFFGNMTYYITPFFFVFLGLASRYKTEAKN